jgi:hypothetical protein
VSPAERLVVARALRGVAVLAIFTAGALLVTGGDVAHPHGNPLLYATAVSWLIAVGIGLPASLIFRRNPRLLPLARRERDGDVYDVSSVRAFKWLLLHTPLGWINQNLSVSARPTDWDRLLREMNGAEAVHWLTCVLASILGLVYVARGHAGYGYAMLLIRIPFDLYPTMLLRRNRGRICRLLRRRCSGGAANTVPGVETSSDRRLRHR